MKCSAYRIRIHLHRDPETNKYNFYYTILATCLILPGSSLIVFQILWGNLIKLNFI